MNLIPRTQEEINRGLAKLDKKDFLNRKIKSLKAQIQRAIHENRLAAANDLRNQKANLEAKYNQLYK